ncbi:hypothetical protein [Actinocorallia aurantiaca]|uniref:hypothetical protein n=1 Tax=Actinocorallia aurantiaca TaxID=46204 RepID=UPI0031D91908
MLGFTPLQCGLTFLPVAILIVAVAPLTPALVERHGANRVVGVLSLGREASGILGVGAVGLVVSTREAAARADGADPVVAFTAGYADGPRAACLLLIAGAVIAWRTLPGRAPVPAFTAAPEEVPASLER